MPLVRMLSSFSEPLIKERRFLIILDLNGTILCRLTKQKEIIASRGHPNYKPPAAKIRGEHPVYFRPYLCEFLETLASFKKENQLSIDLAIWTSAMQRNADAMVNEIIAKCSSPKISLDLFKFVWDQSKCISLPNPSLTKPLFLKPLKKILENYPELYAPDDILIIDDSKEKFTSEEQEFLLELPSYDVTDYDSDYNEDNTLEILNEWFVLLKENIKEASLRRYANGNPPKFKTSETLSETTSSPENSPKIQVKDIDCILNDLKL